MATIIALFIVGIGVGMFIKELQEQARERQDARIKEGNRRLRLEREEESED